MDIKEILVLHHSHLDVGYTHSQPIVWELQREFIDHALDLLDETADWDGKSAPKWTIEATAQILKWLETADHKQIDRLKYYIAQQRLGLSGLEFNTTPLCTAEQLVKQLKPVKRLRNLLDVEIKTVNQHDVNGIPWTAVDLLSSAGIELLIMAINLHLGGPAEKRPSVFRWKGASGAELYVMNGAHYTMFDQLLYTWENSIQAMQEGLNTYLEHLAKMDYRHDFIYLTTAAAPVCWDNSPPSMDVARLIRTWNERGLQPGIRFITTNELLQKIKSLPPGQIETHSGDWTDFWNFGCASTAEPTKVNLHAKHKLYKADLLHAFSPDSKKYYHDLAEKTWRHLNLFDEHTWGSFNSMDPDNIFSKAQFNIKDHSAYAAHELAEYLLVDQLEAITANAKSADEQEGALILNLSGAARKEYIRIPDAWQAEGKRLRTARFGWDARCNQPAHAPWYGPVEVPPYSFQFIPFSDIAQAEPSSSLQHGEITAETSARRLNTLEKTRETHTTQFIESEFYRLEFDPDNNRILRVYDKMHQRDLLDSNGDYTFFQPVRERTDPLFREDRRAYYSRELEKEQYDISCWNSDWRRILETATHPQGYEIETSAQGISLTLAFAFPGIKDFKQKILLHALQPLISLSASFNKEDIRTPESLYFVFPLQLQPAWRCHFDTAGSTVELDVEQLKNTSKDWLTVESYVAVHDEDYGAALFCPDAPMVQVGDFNFGKRSQKIIRSEHPLLLAWPMNNYWDTNFRPSQPGFIELTYYLTTFAQFDPARIRKSAMAEKIGLEVHPAIALPQQRQGTFIEVDHDSIEVLHVRRAEQEQAILIRLINQAATDVAVHLVLPRNQVQKAERVTVLEENLEDLQVIEDGISLTMRGRSIESVKIYVS